MLYRMFLSLVMLSILWPVCFLEVGVQLTYAALFGIWCGMQVKNKFLSYGIMCLAIGIMTNLVTALWFHSVSLMGFLLNPFLAPSVALLSVYLGVPALLGVITSLPVLSSISTGTFYLLDWLESFVHWCSQFTWGYYKW